jgi:hypothetical protein
LSGKFIDAPVSGLAYSCTGSTSTAHSGLTDANGSFSYEAGQNCVFSVGNVTLGASLIVPNDGVVTPYDVAKVSRTATTDPGATAIAQFLQSLNSSGNAQSLTISAGATQALNSVAAVTLASPTTSVASQATLTSLVQTVATATSNSNLTLVSPTSAQLNLSALRGCDKCFACNADEHHHQRGQYKYTNRNS